MAGVDQPSSRRTLGACARQVGSAWAAAGMPAISTHITMQAPEWTTDPVAMAGRRSRSQSRDVAPGVRRRAGRNGRPARRRPGLHAACRAGRCPAAPTRAPARRLARRGRAFRSGDRVAPRSPVSARRQPARRVRQATPAAPRGAAWRLRDLPRQARSRPRSPAAGRHPRFHPARPIRNRPAPASHGRQWRPAVRVRSPRPPFRSARRRW